MPHVFFSLQKAILANQGSVQTLYMQCGCQTHSSTDLALIGVTPMIYRVASHKHLILNHMLQKVMLRIHLPKKETSMLPTMRVIWDRCRPASARTIRSKLFCNKKQPLPSSGCPRQIANAYTWKTSVSRSESVVGHDRTREASNVPTCIRGKATNFWLLMLSL